MKNVEILMEDIKKFRDIVVEMRSFIIQLKVFEGRNIDNKGKGIFGDCLKMKEYCE